MRFLFDSHRYFEERSDVPFFQGLVAVFMNGGITFLTTIITLIWLAAAGKDNIALVIENVGLTLFVYSFFSSFLTWFVMAVIFYLFILWDGIGRMEFFSMLSMAGLGFVPLMLASAIELVATVYFAIKIPASSVATTTHVLIGGEFGLIPAVAMMAIHTLMLLWSGHVWIGGVHQLGGVSPGKSTFAVLLIVLVLWVELLVLALL
jgi:hypothetical protein